MIPAAEAIAQRRITKHFIAADLIEITLKPRLKISDGEAGHIWQVRPPRAPQNARVVPLTNQATERLSADGRSVLAEFVLIMDHEAAVAVFDVFEARGRKYEVVHVQEKRDYQTKAELITVG